MRAQKLSGGTAVREVEDAAPLPHSALPILGLLPPDTLPAGTR
jgi:hypothetical protein